MVERLTLKRAVKSLPAMSPHAEPCAANDFQQEHVLLLLRSYGRWVGESLVDENVDDLGRVVYEAPMVLLSHNTEADPVLTYGNLAAQELFEMSWEELTSTHSRFTAEAPAREERARLLARVSQGGYIDDYSGVRVSKKGRRFQIDRATVWNLVDDSGAPAGQAATFSEWVVLDQ